MYKAYCKSRKSRSRQKLEDWDFQTNNSKPLPKRLPIFLADNYNESEIERFERYNRQLARTVSSCSLCPKGYKDHVFGHIEHDPHYPQNIWYKDIVLLKYEPEDQDVNGLYDSIKPILAKYNLSLKNFYYTTIIKCPNHAKSSFKCPYWRLELSALARIIPKIWIVFDDRSASHLGLNYKIGKFDKLNNNKVLFTNINHSSFETILKIIANPQLRKRLYPF